MINTHNSPIKTQTKSFSPRAISLYALLCCAISSSLADYTGRLPNSITLNSGQNVTQKAIATCNHNGCYFNTNSSGTYGYAYTYSTIGDSTSSLKLQATLPSSNPKNYDKMLFYMSDVGINPHSSLEMTDFYAALITGNLHIDNATLKFKAKQNNNPLTGSVSGSSFELHTQSHTTLTNHATLQVEAASFLNQNFIEVRDGSTLSVQAQNISNESNIHISGGNLTLTGNVYNIGQKSQPAGIGSPSNVATITNDGGNIAITGSVFNGGKQSQTQTIDCRIKGCGGGNLINKGGTINIQGTLNSTPEDNQSSSIQIYGGSIKATTVTNKAGSALIFGTHNGQLGRLEASVENEGAIKVDTTGITLGNHQFIIGTLNDKRAEKTIELFSQGGQSEFILADLQNTTLNIKKNTQAIDTYLQTLDEKTKNIIQSLDKYLGDSTSIFTYGDRTFLLGLSEQTLSSASSMFLQSTPLALYSITHNTITPLRQQALTTYNNGSLSGAGRGAINISILGANAQSNSLSAPLYGLSINTFTPIYNHQLSFFGALASSHAKQSLSQSQTQFDIFSFLGGFIDRISLNALELTFLSYYANARNDITRHLNFDQSMYSSKLSQHQFSALAQAALKLKVGRIFIKPFIGLDYTLYLHNAFKETPLSQNMAIFSYDAQHNHIFSLLLGSQMQYHLNALSVLFGGMQIQQPLTSALNLKVYYGDALLKLDSPKTLGFSFHLGVSRQIYRHISLSLYALYGHSYMDLTTYSGSLSLSYHF